MTEAGHVLKARRSGAARWSCFKVERVEKRRVRVKLEISQTDGEGELKDELDRARSGT